MITGDYENENYQCNIKSEGHDGYCCKNVIQVES